MNNKKMKKNQQKLVGKKIQQKTSNELQIENIWKFWREFVLFFCETILRELCLDFSFTWKLLL